MLHLLIQYLLVRGWEIHLTKNQEPSTSVKFLGVKWCESSQDISSKLKGKLSHLAPPTAKKRHNAWRVSFNLGCKIFPIWVFYFIPFTREAARFEWDPKQVKALQLVQDDVQDVLPPWPLDPGDPKVLDVSGRQGCCLEHLTGSYTWITTLRILEQIPAMLQK